MQAFRVFPFSGFLETLKCSTLKWGVVFWDFFEGESWVSMDIVVF